MNHPVYGLSSTRNIQLLPLEAHLPSDASGEISELNAGPPSVDSDGPEEVVPYNFTEESSEMCIRDSPEDDWKLKIPLGGDNKRNLCASAVEEHGNVDEVLAKCKYTIERTSVSYTHLDVYKRQRL